MRESFSQNELWLLLTHFSPSVVVGFQDPTRGLLADEVALLRDSAWKNLVDRGLIHNIKGDDFAIDVSIRDQIKLTSNPIHSVIVGIQTIQTYPMVHSFHYGSNNIVHLLEGGEDQYWIEFVNDRQAIVNLLMNVFQTSVFFVENNSSFYLPEKSIEEVRSLCATGEFREALQILLLAGLEKTTAEVFFSVLNTPIVNMSFVVFSDRNKKDRTHVKGFAVLASDHGLWILEPTGEKDNLVKISQATKAELEQKIDIVLP